MNRHSARLLQNKLFAALTSNSQGDYADRLIERNVWKGEIVENEGNFCESMGFVVSGCLSVEKYSSNGNFVMIDLLIPGDSFGDDLILSDDPYYKFSIEATNDAKLLILPRSLLLEMITADPGLRETFNQYLSNQIHRRDRRVLVLSQRNLRQKISAYLISLLRERGDFDEEELLRPASDNINATRSVELPVSKEVAAHLLAMPRPSFSRELLRMEEDGLIKVSGRTIWLSNLTALENGGSSDDEDDEE